jgi:protein O-mannosyl-transferase
MLGSFSERGVGSQLLCYLVSLGCFIASVLSKEISLTLPAMVLLYDFCFMNGDRWSLRKTRFLFFYLPLLACGAFSILKVLYMKSMIVDWWQKIDLDYALQQARIVGHGIYLLLLPIGLTFDYDFPNGFFPHPVLRAWPVLLIILLIAGVAKYYPKGTKMVTFCVLWYLLTIAPTNSFLPRLDLLSERNLYIPSFGVFLLVAFFATTMFHAQDSIHRKISISCLLMALAFQITLLFDRNVVYQSNTLLWEDTVKKAPGKTRAWQNLSHYYLMDSNYDKAYDSLQGLLRSNPSKKFLSSAQSKLGILYSRKGNLPQAIAAFEEGARLDPSAPISQLNLGGLYSKQGKFFKAKAAYEKAETLFKSNLSYSNIPPNLYLNKAHILFRMGLFEQAETAVNTLLRMAPESRSGHQMLENIYTALGKTAEASREFSKAKKNANLR